MTGRTKWSDVRDGRLTTDVARKRYAAARERLDADLATHARTLRDVRRARALTQTQLATSLDVSQAQVSRIETQADLYLSTLRSYVEAMGGELEIRVVFGDGAWADVEFGEQPRTREPKVTIVRVRAPRGGGADGVRHVVPRASGWAVTRGEKGRAISVLASKREAIARAREILSREGGGEIVVHGRGGRATG